VVEDVPGRSPIKIEIGEAPNVEVLEEIYGDVETRGPADRVISASRPLFTEAIELVQSCAAAVSERLDRLEAHAPDEVEMQLAVKLVRQPHFET
jgi:hypothetical protein